MFPEVSFVGNCANRLVPYGFLLFSFGLTVDSSVPDFQALLFMPGSVTPCGFVAIHTVMSSDLRSGNPAAEIYDFHSSHAAASAL